ncbi:uncharacterized protein RBU33_027402 isoform 2-T3 [Hipposideros larvatus]
MSGALRTFQHLIYNPTSRCWRCNFPQFFHTSPIAQEDESSQSSSAGSTPGGPPQEPPPGPDAHSSDSPDPPKDGGNSVARIAGIVALGVTGGVVAVGAAPVVLGAMGFTGAGIAASSIAAKMMSVAAVANGGGVAAGSLVATLQSVGAAGLSASSNALLGLSGASFGAWLGSKIKKPPSSPPAEPSTEAERDPHVGGDSPGPQDDSPQNDKPPASQNCSQKDEK